MVSQSSSRLDTCAEAKQVVRRDNLTCNAESNAETSSTRDGEMEHYQSPRSDLRIFSVATETERNEQLYDDIALWADFTARQRDVVGKGRGRENEDAKSDKKAWNRFTANRKSRVASDLCSTEARKRAGNEGGNEIEDSPDQPENNGLVKRNTFQKLISRMEHSFAKVSARSPASLSTDKPSASSHS